MVVTMMFLKLNRDYADEDNLVNNTLKYELQYNNQCVAIFYSKANGLGNTLRVVVTVDDVDYLFVEYISTDGTDYHLNTYIDEEIYSALQFSFFQLPSGKCPTNSFFEAINNHILSHNPTHTPERHRNYYVHHNSEYCPYFETIVRTHMFDKMRQRIWGSYDKELAKRLLM